MKIVLDTNVLIAAFATEGHCHRIYEAAMVYHEVFISQFILNELKFNLKKKLHYSPSEIEVVLNFIQQHAALVKAIPALAKGVSRDPDDDNIIALASASKADLIVTGDKDLLVLKQFQGIQIIPPNAFWQAVSL